MIQSRRAWADVEIVATKTDCGVHTPVLAV